MDLIKHRQECRMTAWEAKLRRCGANDLKPQRPVCDCGAEVKFFQAENQRLQDALWSACTFIAHENNSDPHFEFDEYVSDPPRKYGEPYEE